MIWFDVGAWHGEWSLAAARESPELFVYAFEPLPSAAEVLRRQSTGMSNYVVVERAVTDYNGEIIFYVNGYEQSSSVLPIDPGQRELWKGGEWLTQETPVTVACCRLDTFMNDMGIEQVDCLKIDAQGHDLTVVKSLGSRLRDVERVTLEASMSIRLYKGGHTREETLGFMEANDFCYTGGWLQSYNQEENMTFVRKK